MPECVIHDMDQKTMFISDFFFPPWGMFNNCDGKWAKLKNYREKILYLIFITP